MLDTLTTVWYQNWKGKTEDLLSTEHGKTLAELVKDLTHLKMIDLGCGAQNVKPLFDDYQGVDLPLFNVYTDDLTFIESYDLVLMNAFIDVMQFPIQVLNRILPHCKNYVVIHRQELIEGPTEITQEKAYGGWTYHSKISRADFYPLVLEDFTLVDVMYLGFDNWEDGGCSILLRRR